MYIQIRRSRWQAYRTDGRGTHQKKYVSLRRNFAFKNWNYKLFLPLCIL